MTKGPGAASTDLINRLGIRFGLGLKPRLILIFIVVKVIPLILLAAIAWAQLNSFGKAMSTQAIDGTSVALNDSATESIERITTDAAFDVARFLYDRDADLQLLAAMQPSAANYEAFGNTKISRIADRGTWQLSDDGMSWERVAATEGQGAPAGASEDQLQSLNQENNDVVYGSGYHFRAAEEASFTEVPLYDSISFIGLDMQEKVKVLPQGSTKTAHPFSSQLQDVSTKEGTYIGAESYGEQLASLKPGEIYVSGVIGAYVPSHFIGMYTPKQLIVSAVNAELTALNALPANSDITLLSEGLTALKGKWLPDLRLPSNLSDAKLMEQTALAANAELATIANSLTSSEVKERVSALQTKIAGLKFTPEEEAYAGKENPNGVRFEGIVRWAMPVTDDGSTTGNIIGYVSFALNHDHLMELVDHIMPDAQRYTDLPSAYDGNYAFIWDYQCRNIAHPRHHSIVGYDADTGYEQIPWLEASIYQDLLDRTGGESLSDLKAAWPDLLSADPEHDETFPAATELITGVPLFDNQSREKKAAAPLTADGLVGLDGRYLNSAPQCTGWMELTKNGGSGSFYILWSGIYKLTTAAAIPYYTGQYAPSESNGWSRRGFAMLTVGAGLDTFQEPTKAIGEDMEEITAQSVQGTAWALTVSTSILIALVVIVAIWLANSLTRNIQVLINGVTRFRRGERRFRFATRQRDEFGKLADSFDAMADNIVDNTSSSLCITDHEMRIVYVNDVALKMYGHSFDEMVGRCFYDFSMSERGSAFDPIHALHEGREAEVLYHAPDDTYYKCVASHFDIEGSKEPGYYILATDVSAIQTARKSAEAASEAKTSFLSNMSHEMRTPMNAIIGMTTIGRDAESVEKKDYCFDKISNASNHLLGVINDVLDISKIESGKFELSMVDADFERIMQRVVSVAVYRIEEKHQNLIVNIDPSIPHSIITDDQRLAQVVTNLLSNANKFTPEGGTIRMEARLLSDDTDTVTLRVSVSDTGIGISAEQRARIFDEFEQAENATSRKFGGTGLGLAISKRIVERMGGEIWVESTIGEGSVFTFTVVAQKGPQNATELLLADVDWDTVRILAVDDEQEIREFFAAVAERYGLHCDTASSGDEAIKLVEETGHYDIFFVDWRMPGMNGIELSERIRDIDHKKSVVIMISATEWSIIEASARKAGVNLYLPKPLFPSVLVDCINGCIGVDEAVGVAQKLQGGQVAGEAFSSGSHKDPPNTFPGRHILLVEDNDVNREIALALLEPTEAKISTATNGLEAVAMFEADPTEYDVILMDIQMPEMDGLEATRAIRAMGHPRAQRVPIIAMTANVFKEDIEKSLEVGMNDHLGKPIDFAELLTRLRKFMGKR